jgi:hypothetical protein
MPQIEDIRPSNRQGKRFAAIMDDGTRIHFGQLNSITYLDQHNKAMRDAYIARHYGSESERPLIDSLTPSPALFSIALLWSFYNSEKTTLAENVRLLNQLLSKK